MYFIFNSRPFNLPVSVLENASENHVKDRISVILTFSEMQLQKTYV